MEHNITHLPPVTTRFVEKALAKRRGARSTAHSPTRNLLLAKNLAPRQAACVCTTTYQVVTSALGDALVADSIETYENGLENAVSQIVVLNAHAPQKVEFWRRPTICSGHRYF